MSRAQWALSGDELGSALFYSDGRNYDVAAAIERSLGIVVAGQGADRIAVRAIHIRGRVLAGVYSLPDLTRLARDLAGLERNGEWHLYFAAQRVCAPITGRLLPGAAGTVSTAGVAAYVTLPIDLDPRPDAKPGAAVGLAYDLATFLRRRGVPGGSILIQQSGRGAYLLVAIEPQPITARSVIRDAIKLLATFTDRVDASVSVDAVVHDPPRVLRIGGTTNRKLDADPSTPAWILEEWVPGVRAPWSIIERLAGPTRRMAQAARPKLRVMPGGLAVGSRSGRTLRELFASRGWIRRERADGICDIRCPNAAAHTDARDGAILYPPREAGGPGWLKCSHAHCATLSLFDVYRLLEGRA